MRYRNASDDLIQTHHDIDITSDLVGGLDSELFPRKLVVWWLPSELEMRERRAVKKEVRDAAGVRK